MKAKILIVDFDSAFAKELEQMLVRKGYSVIEHPNNLADAVELCQIHSPDFILMDIYLQGMESKFVFRNSTNPMIEVPILYLVGLHDTQAIEKAINVGRYGCLIKPIEASRLYAAIETTLSKHEVAQELKLRNARTDAIFGASPDIYLLIDYLKKQIIDCRSGHETEFFLMQNQITGKKYSDVLPQKLAVILDSAIEKIGQDQVNFTGQYRMRNLDTYQYYEVRFITIKEQNEILCIVRNVSQLKQSEEQFKESKNQLESILNTTDDVIWSVSVDGKRILYINPAAKRHYGLDENYFSELKSATDFLNLLYPDDRPKIASVFADQINTQVEYRIVRADNGQIVWFADNIVFKKNSISGQIETVDGVARNITQQKTAQLQLEETQKLLGQISENSPDLIYLYDYQTKNIIYANRMSSQIIFGFDAQRTRHQLLENIHPQDKKQFKKYDFDGQDNENFVWENEFRLNISALNNISQTLTEGVSIDVSKVETKPKTAAEIITKTKADLIVKTNIEAENQSETLSLAQSHTASKAEWKWYCLREKIFEYDTKTGKPKSILATASDINPQKQARAELLLKNKAIEDSIIAVAIADACQESCPIIYVNQAFCNLTHYTPEEVIGRNWDFLYSDDLMQPEIKIIEKARKQSKFCSVILRNYTKEKQLFWSSFALSPIQDMDGLVTHFVVMQADLSRIKKLEEQVSQITTAVESAQDGICITDISGNIIYLNQAFRYLFGYDETELALAGGPMILTGQQSNDLQIEQSLGYGKSWSGEFGAYHQNQTRIPVFLRANPIKDSQNHIIGFMRNYTDISEKIYMRNLQIAKDTAEQATLLKQQFLDNISHELRTPMNGIVAMSDYLLTTPLSSMQANQARIIQESAKYLHAILNDILDLSKLENNKIKIFEQEFDTSHLLDFISALHYPIALKKGLELKVRAGSGLPAILKADRQRLAQVCNNLLSNGIKFTQSGSVCLVLDAVNSYQELSDWLPEDEYYLHIPSLEYQDKPDLLYLIGLISDTGIGIIPELHQQIFEKFDQVNNLITRTSEGTGLGLFIVKQLVELMGGRVWLKSVPDLGSSFGFWLPATKSGSIENFPNPKSEHIQTKHPALVRKHNLDMKVLLVEDKKVNQMVAISWLESFGCTIKIAENGLKALEVFEQEVFDIVFMDIRMPVLDGLQATKRLRECYQILPPIIALSADVSWQDPERQASAGLDDFIGKPILFQTLLDKLIYWKNNKTKTSLKPITQPPTAVEQALGAGLELVLDLDTYPAFNPEILDRLSNQSSNKAETGKMIKQLISYFFQDAQEINEQIGSYKIPENLNNLEMDLHTLKGLCATIGASRLSQLCLQTENQIKREPQISNEFLSSLYYQIEKNLILLKTIINQKIGAEN